MTVREYLKDCNKYADVTFIKARARKDAHTPGYHAEYQTTPIRTLVDWEKSNLMDYYILNDRQCPIDWLSGAPWKVAFDNGRLISLLVIISISACCFFGCTAEEKTAIRCRSCD